VTNKNRKVKIVQSQQHTEQETKVKTFANTYLLGLEGAGDLSLVDVHILGILVINHSR
jgi:hypothetical protein